jgi:thiol-disulfide isomerase/thioredoxin
MKVFILALLVALPNLLSAQANLLKTQSELIGTKLEKLTITDYILNEPADKDFSGKLKVLEFWATWCKPCLKAVPHMNDLQRKFKNQNIIFLSVTYQKPEETVKTLEKVKFETVVVSDQTRVLHKDLRIVIDGYMPIPRTVLVDGQNRIVWYGSPKELTVEVIEMFLKKQTI